MRGLVFAGPGEVQLVDGLPEPRIEAPGDALIAVEAAGLCGSDLHPYLGAEPAGVGVVPGHEAVGRVLAVGDEVVHHRPGDRVLVPFSTSCGACAPCRRGVTARCSVGQLFGWGPPDAPATGLDGAQAERLRVPLADTTLVAVPDDLDTATAVLCTDNLPTAWEAVARTGLAPGEAVLVVGLGAVGLCAIAAARAQGADPVLAIDPVADRRARALEVGADAALSPEAAADVEPVTAVIEAAGTTAAQALAIRRTAPGGRCSVIAVQTAARFACTPVEAYDRNLTLIFGRASVRTTLPSVLAALADGHLTAPTAWCVTHPDTPLVDGPDAYRRFAAREPGVVKLLLRP